MFASEREKFAIKKKKGNNETQSTQVTQPNVKIFPHRQIEEEESRWRSETIELFIRNNVPSELNIKDAAVLNEKLGNF